MSEMSKSQQPATRQIDASIEVIVLIICYNGRSYLDECLRSLLASDDAHIIVRVVLLDNASSDDSAAYVTKAYPQVDVHTEPVNRGYAGGANAGWAYAQIAYPKSQFLVLLNQDTVVHSGWLTPLVDFLDQNSNASLVGPKVMMYPETTKINTIGNRSHFLGFGFVTKCGQTDTGQFDQPHQVDFVSGAALMVRTSLIDQFGLFDEEFFMYLEDEDLAWKLHQIGYASFVQPASVIYHRYNPNAPTSHYYYLERNRWILLLVYYTLPTLLLLAPAFAFMEFGQIAFAILNGKVFDKLRIYGYFLRPAHCARLWQQRRRVQRRRKKTDRQFMASFSGTIDHAAVNGLLLRYVGNPLLGTYWWIVKRLMFW